MTAPLFDVKNKLSEYVQLAMNQECIKISRYGKIAAVLVDAEEYESLSRQRSSMFSLSLEKWLNENPATEENCLVDASELEVLHGKKFVPRNNPFISEE